MLPSIQPGDAPITTLEEVAIISGNEQNNQTKASKLTPSQQRKRDALDMAEFIYDIYNKNCPAPLKSSVERKYENV